MPGREQTIRLEVLRRRLASVLVLLPLSLCNPATAQQVVRGKPDLTRPHPAFGSAPSWPTPDARSATISGVVSSFYDAISAPANHPLDRDRLKSLFTPDGRLAFVQAMGPDNKPDVVYLSPDQYADNYERAPDPKHPSEGFFDKVIANQVVQFGDMAHVWGSYESRHSPSDPRPFTRGMKSLDLVHRGDRWYILQVFFEREDEAHHIPARYLSNLDL